MANPDHLQRLMDGALAWNAWRSEHPRVRPDLRQSHLTEANLSGYDLHAADLRGSSLLAANVSGADLRGADLSECDLRFCEWRRARLSGAKLRGAGGADNSMIAAAARADWRDRFPPAQVARFAVVAAVAVVAWAISEHAYSDGVSVEAASPAIELAAVMSEAGLTEWAVEGVAISGGLMRLRLSVDEMTDEAYFATLRAACRTLEERTVAPPVERIEVLRRDGEAGWLFEQTGRCRDVLSVPPERLAAAVGVVSRPIRQRPSPDDAR